MGLRALVGLMVVLGMAWGAGPAAARPMGAPGPARVLGLEPQAADMALLRWEREDGARYRLCVAGSYSLADTLACWDTGGTEEWSVGVPRQDGGVYYLTLQACRDGECAGPVRAGAIGRRLRDGYDFYGVAVPLPDGRARLGGFVRASAATLRFYRAAAGTGEMLASACPGVPAGEACSGAELTVPGAVAGIGAARDGAGEQGITLQVRDTPTIAFMFDDGTGIVSGGKYLMQSIMDDYGVKGSFFITGRAMQIYPGAVRALAAGGHRVGNHTWSHPYLTSFGDAAIGQELDQTEAIYRALVPGGTLKPCFRAPNGDFNARVLGVVRGRGYQQYTQTVSSMDYARASAGQIIANVMAGAKDGATVSFHTQEPQTAIALRTLIPLLQAEGYRFGVVC